MIRRLQEPDIDRVMALWLGTNLKAHDFVPAAYWRNNFELVKEMLPQAEVYVYESAGEIQAFAGLTGEYIEGIFVSGEMQSQGIGKRLLDHMKVIKDTLHLSVYGDVPISNNLAENAIRPFVVGRKNWLFCDSVKGAESSAIVYSLVETAKANGIEPYGYLLLVLSMLPYLGKSPTHEELEKLMPWHPAVRHREHIRK